jgi:hypothetical protein
MKPLFSARALVTILLAWIIAFSFFYEAHLEWQMAMPAPIMDARVRPSLAMVYWVKPSHAAINVLLNAMYNTPGDEGVMVYVVGGTYNIWGPIYLRARDSLVCSPQTVFMVQDFGINAVLEVTYAAIEDVTGGYGIGEWRQQ